MRIRTCLGALVSALALGASAVAVPAQDQPARRLSSIVAVAVEEYAKGVDSGGRLISQQEYDETLGFLAGARDAAAKLPGHHFDLARVELDSLTAAVRARVSPAALAVIHRRFVAALGEEGALELPTSALSIADGRTVFRQECVTCHGDRGMGDGPQARGMNPPPPAIGDPAVMADASPALLFRVISVGVPGTRMPSWGATLTVQQRWEVVSYLQTLHAERVLGTATAGQTARGAAPGPAGGVLADPRAARVIAALPSEAASFAWQAERSDAQLAQAIRHGIPGTSLRGDSALTDGQVAELVAYVRGLPVRDGRIAAPAPAPVVAADTSAADAARTVLATLDQALAAARAGRASDAGDRAFDAYLAFEPLEGKARARSPGVVAAMERRFADFKGAIRSGDLQGAQRTRDAIEASLPTVVDLTKPATEGWAAFLQSLLIILREGFEAILVIGAVVAFLIKTGHRDRLRSIWAGAGLGILASAATAIVLQTALRAVPASRDLLEGITMLVAVVVLFSVSYWLISKVDAAHWQRFIREKVSEALAHGGGSALAFVAFLAVYREGAETALFYQALFGEGPHLLVPLLLGLLAGSAGLALIFTLFYRYGVRIPLRPFFAITSLLLYYMAIVFMGKGIRELQEVNVLPITLLRGAPHVEAMGIFPTLEGLVGQLLLVLLFVAALAKTFWPRRSVEPDAAGDAPPPAADDTRVESLAHRVGRLEERLAALERTVSSPTASGESAAPRGGDTRRTARRSSDAVTRGSAPRR